MRNRTRLLMSAAILAVVVAAAAITGEPSFGQGPPPGDKPSAAGAGTWATPRTPWGDPDVQGIWGGSSMTPLERPEKYAGREFLTEEEVADLERVARAEPARDARSGNNHEDVEGAYNDVFTHRATTWGRTRRTSLIVDPLDGRIPPLTPEARKREEAARRRPQSRSFGGHYTVDTENPVADNPEDRESDRCKGMILPFSSTWNFFRMVQAPGHVSIYIEHSNLGGSYRHIALDGRPHLPSSVRERYGDSVGRWDGDTLVVDTTNFTNQTNFQGSRENLHLVERYTRVGPDLITYRITIDDPTTFTRQWTIEIPLTRQVDRANMIYETACHEGNYGLTGILAGARTKEREEVAKRTHTQKQRGSH